MRTIELEPEQVDEIVLFELKDCIKNIIDNGDDPQLVDSFLDVLEYLVPYTEYTEYVSNLRRNTPTIEINSVNEHEDGSADVTIEASPEQTKMLASEGMKYLLIKAAYDVTEEDIVARLSNH